jgi:transcriptional regulator with XRE-family HTH domain
MSRPIPKATGKRYRTVSEMLEDTGTSPEIVDSVKEVESQDLVPLLTGIRVARGLTQKQVAELIGCSQGRISKLEQSRDLDLRIADVIDYLGAVDGSIWLTIGPKPLAEHIKLHVRALRQLLEELVALSGDDPSINQGINHFLDEILVETGQRLESAKEAIAQKQAAIQKPTVQVELVGGAGSTTEMVKKILERRASSQKLQERLQALLSKPGGEIRHRDRSS